MSARQTLHEEVVALATGGGDVLAAWPGLAVLPGDERVEWQRQTAGLADQLLQVFRQREDRLRHTYECRFPDHAAVVGESVGFGEFVCWLDHLAYARAIDDLAATGEITIPPDGFAAALVGRTGPGTL